MQRSFGGSLTAPPKRLIQTSYHHRENMPRAKKPRYSDDEIITLARSNRGYGLERMIRKIYFENGTKRSQGQSAYYFEALMIIQENNDSTGEDLYSWIEDPEATRFVTREMYLRLTGETRVPRGAGMSQGGRTSKPTRKTSGRGNLLSDVPLPPQDFDWGGVIPLWNR